MQRVCGARHFFVRTCCVEHAHEDIAVNYALHSLGDQAWGEGKARIRLHAVGIDGDDRNLRHACLVQCTADKSDVVGGTAAAAGLAHEDGGMV